MYPLSAPFPHVLAVKPRYRASFAGDIVILLLPIAGLLNFDLGGQLSLLEILLLLIASPLLRSRGRLLLQRRAALVILGLVLWFLGQVLTDLLRETPLSDIMRGWSKILVLSISFAVALLILTTTRRLILWLTGNAILGIFQAQSLFPPGTEFPILWKFGVGNGVLSLLMFAWVFVNRRKPLERYARSIAVLMIAYAAVSFLLNARSGAGLTLISALLLLGIGFHSVRSYIQKRTNHSNAMIVVLLFGVSCISLIAYTVGADSGLFGEEAKSKYEMQRLGGFGPLGILVGGRSEVLASTQAVADSPIIGHGSWAKDRKYVDLMIELKRTLQDYEATIPQGPDIESDLIPTHSHLFGAWVEAGLLGALFWLFVMRLAYRAFVNSLSGGGVLQLIVLTSFAGTIWTILFSPLGATGKVTIAFTIALYVIALMNRNKRSKKVIA